MLGPVVNSAAIIIGAFAGTASSRIINADVSKKLISVLGCVALYIGVTMSAKGNALPPVVLSLLLGTLIGELIHLESLFLRLSTRVASIFRRRMPGQNSIPQQAFEDQMAVATILFCASGLGVLGAIREGMSGDASLLLVKGVLDGVTAMLFAAGIGGVVGVLAIPQFLVQLALFLIATIIAPLATPEMFADFFGCGGLIMMGAALRQFGLVQVPVINMLPALVIVMPVSSLWTTFMAV